MSGPPRKRKVKKKKKKKAGGRSPRPDPGVAEDPYARMRAHEEQEAELARQRAYEEERRIQEQMRREQERRLEEERMRAAAEAAARQAAAAAPRKPPSDDDEDDYEDDFDDYDDDDFEDDEPPPPKPAPKPASVPAAVIRAPGVKPTVNAPATKLAHKPRTGHSGGIGPSRQIVVPKAIARRGVSGIRHPRAKRVDALKKLITLAHTSADLYAQAPLPAADLYYRQLRSAAIRQVQVQSNDGDVSIGTMTDPFSTANKGMQFPDDIGGGRSKSDDSQPAVMDSVRMLKFLRRSAQVMETLLEENLDDAGSLARGGVVGASESKAVDVAKVDPAKMLSGKLVTLERSGLLWASRPVTALALSPSRSSEILVSYSASIEPGPRQDEGLVCVWDIHEPAQPRTVLLCAGQPVQCTFSPNRAHIAIAGTEGGSVVMWDLREPSSAHTTEESLTLGIMTGLRVATYSTDGLGEDGHTARICALQALSGSSSGSVTAGSGGGSAAAAAGLGSGATVASSGSFQVATLDTRGLLIIWVAVEISARASDVDPGLRIGGKVKLVKTSVVDTSTAPFHAHVRHLKDPLLADLDVDIGPGVCDVAFPASDPSKFVIALTTGQMQYGNRFGKRLLPASFLPPHEVVEEVPGLAANTIHYAWWDDNFFLAGFATGSVCLYHTSSKFPITTWHDPSGQSDARRGGSTTSAICVRWAPFRRGVFFVLDGASKVHVWDLIANDRAPLLSIPFARPGSTVLAMAVAPHKLISTRHCVAVSYSSGEVSVQGLSPALTAPNPEAEKRFAASMTSML